MRFIRKISLALILLAAFCAAVYSQQVVRVAGTVFDKETRKPIEGVDVVAYMSDKEENKINATTDKKGKFAVAGLQPGTAIFEFTKEGYKAVGIPRRLSSTDPRISFTFELEKIQRPPGTITPEIKERYDNAMNLYNENKLDEALVILKDLLEKYPDLYQINVNVGIIEIQKKNYDSAIEYFRAAHDGDPENAEIITYIGEACLAKEDYEEAYNWYKMGADKALVQAQAGSPSESLYYMLEKTADLARVLEKYDVAIDYYNKALEIDGTRSYPRLYLGTLLDLQGRREEALINYLKYAESDPNGAEVKNTLIAIQSIAESYENAEETFAQLLADDDGKPLRHLYMGFILARKGGKDEEAIGHLKKYLELDPNDTYGKSEFANDLLTAIEDQSN